MPPTWPPFTGRYDGQEAQYYQSPWMRGMYVGQLDSEQVGGGWVLHMPCMLSHDCPGSASCACQHQL